MACAAGRVTARRASPMDNLRLQLTKCFEAVFPDVRDHAQFDTIGTASFEAWDSVASVTLFAVLEQEFGISLDLDEMAELDSFPAIEDYLRRRMVRRDSE